MRLSHKDQDQDLTVKDQDKDKDFPENFTSPKAGMTELADGENLMILA